MSDGTSDDDSGGLDALTPDVPEERPLDALVPEMQAAGPGGDAHADAPTDVAAIHPRVLEVQLEEGFEWTFALWEDPGAEGVGTGLERLLSGTLLREMSRMPRQEREASRKFVGARILSFESLLRPTRRALQTAGFSESDYDPEEYSERLKAWQNEARAADLEPPARPISIWNLPVEPPGGREGEALSSIEEEMLDVLGDEVWGETPGGMSKLLARGLEEHFDAEIGLGPEGLRRMESYALPDAPEAIRWTAPVVFQALCDFVGVLLHGHYGVRVQWGLCEPDEHEMIPPPMFRDPETQNTIPIGRALVDWSVLPSETTDAPRELADRVDELASSLLSAR